ncbi:MAG TPA: UDP-N-acetylmuramoyl-L-alanyl-D-glutamate--2,6-diaminopimelate ligase [Candidatus Babeliales bacterium]|nr:UDP-N-acetylmuramoyl-L-alanyl-D-glutamate--2,6-diaminopimelate ligase [Candidatus Babeliales bacterium]
MSIYIPIVMPSIFPVTCHTDFVGEGSCFVAIEGYTEDGVTYIKKAIEKGARTIVVHHTTFLDDAMCAYIATQNVTIVRVLDTRKSLAELSAKKAGFPAQNLKIIGITGTKGKTTTSFLLEHILHEAGYKTALISSVQNRICGYNFPSSLTTPQPDYLQQFLKLCGENNVEYVVMEVAAQALTLHRVNGISFCGIIFTNFSHEHLEFYSTLEDYFAAKKIIFTMTQPTAPLFINGDDEHGKRLLNQYCSALAYGFSDTIRGYKGSFVVDPISTIELTIDHYNKNNDFVCSALFGAYNAYNVLASISMALALNIRATTIQDALCIFNGVPGRLQEHVLPNGARCFIDYAHNPESFRVVLSTLRALTSHLIVVFGAGGGRDISKRPMMGYIAAHIADIVVITSDNPRLEDVAVITDNITSGIPEILRHKIVQEPDRKKAIELAYHASDNGSIIALLGKGPDEYQIVGRAKHYFSERTILEQL